MSDPLTDLTAAELRVSEARAAGDRPALAHALIVLSAHLQNADRHDEAIVAATEGVQIDRELGDAVQLVWALENLASRYGAAGRFDEAVVVTQERVDVCRVAGNRVGLASALIYLSAYLQHAGRHDEAIAAAVEGVRIDRELGDAVQLVWALENLASRYGAAGRFGEAVTATQERVDVHRAAGNRPGLASALIYLSAYLQSAARYKEAIAAAEEGVQIDRELGDEVQLAWALENLAARYAAAGQPGDAVTATQERVDRARAALEADPLAEAKFVNVTTSLRALAGWLSVAGRPEEALAVTAQADAAQPHTERLQQLKRLSTLGYGTTPIATQLRDYITVWSLATNAPVEGQIGVVLAHMQGRRCGTPDKLVLRGGQLTLATAGETTGRWSHGDLTYSVWSEGCNLPGQTVVDVITEAFDDWAAVAPQNYFRFQITGDPAADFRLDFQIDDDDGDFGAPGGVMGHAADPPSGDVAFDAAENWTAQDLKQLALHEIGHALGLGHSDDGNSIMAPAISTNAIDGESIEQLRRLYGWTPQTVAPGRSSNRPAIAIAGRPTFVGEPTADRLHMAFRGAGDDRRLRWTVYDGTRWELDRLCAAYDGVPFGSTDGPALVPAYIDGAERVLHMAWKGPKDDNGIYRSIKQVSDPSWSPQLKIHGIGTSAGPALAAFDGTLWLAWRGIGDDYRIRLATYRNNYADGHVVEGIGTSTSPALLAHADRLYLFWRGINSDPRIYFSWRTLANPAWQPQRAVTFQVSEVSGTVQHAIHSANAPTATVWANQIMLAWRGEDDDKRIYLTSSSALGATWIGQVQLADRGTAVGPSLAAWDNKLFMVWRGVPDDDDTRIFYSTLG